MVLSVFRYLNFERFMLISDTEIPLTCVSETDRTVGHPGFFSAWHPKPKNITEFSPVSNPPIEKLAGSYFTCSRVALRETGGPAAPAAPWPQPKPAAPQTARLRSSPWDMRSPRRTDTAPPASATPNRRRSESPLFIALKYFTLNKIHF